MTSAALRPARRLFVVLGTSEAVMLPFLPLLLVQRGMEAATVGLVLAAMALAAFLANPVWGYVADHRLGVERGIVASAGGAAALALLLLLPLGDVGFAIAAVVLSACRAPLISFSDTVALQRLAPDRRHEYGRLRLWLSVGWASAVLVWGALLELGSVELIPVVYAGMCLFVALWVRRNVRPVGPHPVRGHGERRPRLHLSPALLAFLASVLLVNASFAATWNFLALRILELGGGLFIIGLGASLQAWAEVPVMRVLPRLSRRFGARGLYIAGCAVYACVFVGWSFMSHPLWMSAVKLAAGVGFALTYVGSVVIVDDLVPTRLRATGQGLVKGVASGLAPVLGALGGGLLYELAGARTMFVVSAALAVAAGTVAWAAAPSRDKPDAEPLPAAGYEAAT
jgi:PPP family 3-phenylpropionic acid transporter